MHDRDLLQLCGEIHSTGLHQTAYGRRTGRNGTNRSEERNPAIRKPTMRKQGKEES